MDQPHSTLLQGSLQGSLLLGSVFLKTSADLQRRTLGSVLTRMWLPVCSWEPSDHFWDRSGVSGTPFCTVFAKLHMVSCAAAGFVAPPSLGICSFGATHRDLSLLFLAFWVLLQGPDTEVLGKSASDLRLSLILHSIQSWVTCLKLLRPYLPCSGVRVHAVES